MKLAEQLKKIRTSRHLSQDDIASKVFVSRQAVSKWENADGTPDLNTLIKLAEVLDVSLDTLVLGTEPAKESQVDPTVFVFNPNKGVYERRQQRMNFLEFLDRDWWVILIIIAVIVALF